MVASEFARVLSRKSLGKSRRDADEGTKDLADLPEVQTGIEELDQVEDIAFGGAMRIPPAATVVIDDHHLPWSRGDISARAGCFPSCRATMPAAPSRGVPRS